MFIVRVVTHRNRSLRVHQSSSATLTLSFSSARSLGHLRVEILHSNKVVQPAIRHQELLRITRCDGRALGLTKVVVQGIDDRRTRTRRRQIHLLHALGATYYNAPRTSACRPSPSLLNTQFTLRVKTKRPTDEGPLMIGCERNWVVEYEVP